jgi:hypothetical protein
MKKNVNASIIALTIILTLFACSPQHGQGSTTATKMVEVPQTPINPSIAAPTETRTPIPLPTDTQEAVSFPLAESGPYFVGDRVYTFNDNSRNGRMIVMQIYYPALKNVNDAGDIIERDATPDLSGAPYPLILTGTNSGRYLFKSYLASYGFVMVIVQSVGFSYMAPWDNSVIDAPLDFLFVLDRLTSNPPEGLENILDTNRVGVAGYSSDGLFSLDHMMVEDPQVISRIDHFAVAFFGTYLQGREDLSRYFSEKFVAQDNDLAWGVYEK